MSNEILIRPLNLEEKKFLLAVERGDVANVRRSVDSSRKKAHKLLMSLENCV